MKKRVILLAALLAFTLVFTGCGLQSSVTTSFNYKSDKNESTGIYSLKFNKKSGEEAHELKMQEDGKVLVKLNSMVADGDISIKILTNDDKIIYENAGKVLSFNESFILNEGIYKILLDYNSLKRGTLKLELRSDNEFDYYRCANDDNVNDG